MWINSQVKRFHMTAWGLYLLTLCAVFSYSCLWLEWLCCCWTSCSKRVTVSVQGSHCLSLPTSVRRSCGRPSVLQLWTLEEVKTPWNGHWRLNANAAAAIRVHVVAPGWSAEMYLILVMFCVLRHRIWGSRYCSFPPAGHSNRQSACTERGLLQTEPAQPHEPHRHCVCLCGGDILSGEPLKSNKGPDQGEDYDDDDDVQFK